MYIRGIESDTQGPHLQLVGHSLYQPCAGVQSVTVCGHYMYLWGWGVPLSTAYCTSCDGIAQPCYHIYLVLASGKYNTCLKVCVATWFWYRLFICIIENDMSHHISQPNTVVLCITIDVFAWEQLYVQHLLQSWVEIEHSFVAYFNCIGAFEVL